MKNKIIYILVIIFFVLTPLGLLTEYPAWGEWDIDYYKETLGFIPRGIEKFKDFKSLIPDYSIQNLNPILSYYISAFTGIIFIFCFFFLLNRIFNHKKSDER